MAAYTGTNSTVIAQVDAKSICIGNKLLYLIVHK